MFKSMVLLASLALTACGAPAADFSAQFDLTRSPLSDNDSIYLPGMRLWSSDIAKGSSAKVGEVATLPFSHPKAPKRTGTYFIPKHHPSETLPILVLCHGYKDSGWRMVDMFLAEAKRRKVVLVAPDAAGDQWLLPKAGKFSSDTQHAQDALQWLRTHIGHPSRAQVAVAGHSFGARMASALASNHPVYRKGLILHGRYVESAIGANKVPLWMSGSPKDNQFSFPVMVAQRIGFAKLFPGWPGNGPSLHTYSCDGCLHRPHEEELRDAVDWFLEP